MTKSGHDREKTLWLVSAWIITVGYVLIRSCSRLQRPMGVSHTPTPAELTAPGVIRAHTKGVVTQKSRTWLTNLSRKVFSLSAPMQPAKPRMNITPPTTMKSHTGSKPPRSVIDDRLDSTPWGGEKRGRLPI